jgi:hypothetical protein
MTKPAAILGITLLFAIGFGCSEASNPVGGAGAAGTATSGSAGDGAQGGSTSAGSGGSAGSAACPTGLTACAEGCVDLTTSAAHCGVCGNACALGASCAAGVCGHLDRARPLRGVRHVVRRRAELHVGDVLVSDGHRQLRR